jgi:WD repeat-containing protein 70
MLRVYEAAIIPCLWYISFFTGGGGDGGASDEDMPEDQQDDNPYRLPLSHEVVMGSSHIKAVSCLDIDHSGSRMVTGSLDYTVRLYDFNGMKRDMKAFR